MKTIKVNGREHIVKHVDRPNYYDPKIGIVKMPQPNYMGTGMALCGILQPGQNLKQWLDDKRKRREALGL